MSSKRFYVTDYALINSLGANKEAVSQNLFGPAKSWMSKDSELLHDGDVYVGAIDAQLPELAAFPAHFQSRNNQLALLAYQQIEETIERLKQELGSDRIGLILGTSTSGIASGEAAMAARTEQGLPADYDYRMQEMSNVAEFLAEASGLKGMAMTISTACSSSAKAYITAAELIESGVMDAAVVGGVDTLCGMTINGFTALDSYSSDLCLPSSANRDGINIGEAAALAVLSTQPSKLEFISGGESSDAHHMSAPHPEGEGAKASIRQALQKGNLKADAIDYINLHGTATPKNDEMEAKAVAEIFPLTTPVSSTKAMTGHTLGAAGATEAGICCLVLEQQQYAPHQWDGQRDPEMPELNFVASPEPQGQAIEYCLSNSFAFGGSNVSLIFRAVHD